MVEERPRVEEQAGSVTADVAEDLMMWRRTLIRYVLRALVVLGPFVIIGAAFDAIADDRIYLLFLYLAAYGFLTFITFSRRVSYAGQVTVILFMIYAVGFVVLWESGLSGDGRVFVLTVPFLASLFLGWRAGLTFLIIVALTMAGFGWAFSTGRLVMPIVDQANTGNLDSWIGRGLIVTAASALLVLSQNYLWPRFASALAESRRLARELGIYRSELEQQVAARTADLAQQRSQLEHISQLIQDLADVHNLKSLLDEMVRIVSQHFDVYHVAIFLPDESNETLALKAASSQAGRLLVQRSYQLSLAEDSLVSEVAKSGRLQVRNYSQGVMSAEFTEYRLARTRSHLVLPLRTPDGTPGVLDVQAVEVKAFPLDNAMLWQSLADQLSLLISNARLVDQIREQAEVERLAYGQIAAEDWQRMLLRREVGVVRKAQGVELLDKTVVETADDSDGRVFVRPLSVRGQIIGEINARKPDGSGAWSEEESTLLDALSEQLELALDSARLYEETQRRAAREQLIGEITGRMRASLNMEQVLQTAAQEMREALRVPELAIRLSATEPERSEDLTSLDDDVV